MQTGMRRPQIPWTLNRSYYGTPSEALQVTPGYVAAIPSLCLLQMAETMRHAIDKVRVQVSSLALILPI